MRMRGGTGAETARQRGFTMVELMVALVAGALVVAAMFRLLDQNRKAADLISNRGDFRNQATLATTQVNRAITMAGFGISRMEVLKRSAGSLTDTLTVFSNPGERRTTLVDTATAGRTSFRVFKDSGLSVGGWVGITDSLKHEYVRVLGIEEDFVEGFRVHIYGQLANTYLPGVHDIYPVQRERYFIDPTERTLVRYVDDRRLKLAEGVTEFKVQLLTQTGSPASVHRDIRVVTFSLTGRYKAPAGTLNSMSFSSTVIPRNIL
jgi:prepilin-type N-terminal cleavage/methylation domain-containing protein